MADNIIRRDIVQIAFESSGALKSMKKLNDVFDKFKKSVKGVDDKKFKGLGDTASKVKKKCEKVLTALKKIGNASVTKLNAGLKKAQTHLTTIAKKAAGAAYNGLKKIARISFTSLLVGLGAAAAAVTKFANMASDLEETKNKVDVAFGSGLGNFDGSAADVMKWSKKSTTSMGLAQQTALDTAALFGDMGTSMGLTKKSAADMSMALTQQAADLASFKNMSIDEVTTALNGVFTGETESLKRLGVVMTQANLEQYALSKGMNKTLDEMTEAEKVQLRYNYVMEKTKNATGDYARTGGGFANQLRTLTENFKQLGAVVGALPMKKFAKYMKRINSGLAEIQDILADGFQEGDLKKIGEVVGNTFKDILKRLGPVGETILEIAGAVGDAFQGIINKVKKISRNSKKMEKFKKIWESLKKTVKILVGTVGLLVEKFIEFVTSDKALKVIDDLLNGINNTLIWCKDNWETVKTIMVAVVGIAAGLKLSGFVSSITDALAKLGLLKTELTAMQSLGLTAGITLAITGIIMEGKGVIDTVKNGLNLNNFGEILGGGGALVSGGAAIGGAFGSAVLGGAIAAIPAGIAAFFAGIWDAIKNGIDWLSSALIGAGATAAGAGIGAIIGMCGGPIGAGIGALIGLAVGLVTDLVILVVQKWDVIVAWCKKACSAIGQFFTDAWEWIKGVWASVSSWFNTTVIQPVSTFFGNLWSGVKNKAVSAWNSICSFFSTIASWVNTNIIQPVKNFFLNFFYFIVGLAVTIWEGIKAIIMPIASWVNMNIIQPVKSFFVNLWQAICQIATSIKNGIVAAWITISGWVSVNLIQPIINFFRKLWTSICTIVSNVRTWIYTTWGTICNWVNMNLVQPIVTFFRNLKETVCNIITSVKDWFTTTWGTISSWVNENIIVPVGNYFSNLWTGITEGVTGVKNSIVNAFQGAWDKVTSLWSGITDFFSNLWDGISEWVDKMISKGKEAVGVSKDAKEEKNPKKHANGGLIRSPHLGLVGEAGPEMIIPLSANRRTRGISLWEQTGAMLGLSTYTPERDTGNYTSHSVRSSTTYAPHFELTISGTNDDRTMARKVKRWVSDAMDDMFETYESKTPKTQEV